MQRYRLAKLRDRVPMPERGAGVFFTNSHDGETIDPMNPFYARMIADGDLVTADEDLVTADEDNNEAAKPAARAKGD